jgi:hypothetical protein
MKGKKNTSLKKVSKGVKATEISTQIKKRVGAFRVTNNMAYLNNRGPELPVRYAQNIASKKIITTVGQTIVDVPFTTTERPVRIICSGDMNNPSAIAWCGIQLYRDDIPLGNSLQMEAVNIAESQAFCIQVIDNPSAGTYIYSLRVAYKAPPTLEFGTVDGPVLTVVELRNQ